MAQDLSGLYISQSFQNLVQTSASGAFNVLATATGTEFIPISASYAISSSHAIDADNAASATSASHALNADNAISASYALTASVALNVTPDNLQTVLQQGNSASIDLILSASSGGGHLKINSDGTAGNVIDIENSAGQNQLLYQASSTSNRIIITPTDDQQGSILFSQTNSTKKDAQIQSTGKLILEPSSSAAGLDEGEVRIDGLLHAPYSASVSESLDVSGSVNVDGNIAIGNPSLPGGVVPLNVEGNVYIANGALQVSGSTPLMLSVAGQGSFGIGNSIGSNTNASLTIGKNNTNSADSTLIQGEDNTIGTSRNNSVILGGTSHNMQGEKSAIIGGEGNTMNSSFSGIFGAAASSMNNADTSVIIGGYQHQIQGVRTYILGGNDNIISNPSAEFSGIIGGQGNRIALAVTASAVIGGKGISATANETVYVPNLSVSGSLQDSNGSTGTNGLVLTSDGAGKVEWVAAPGSAAFPFTGSAQITGSLSVTGSTTIRGPLDSGGANGANTLVAGAAAALGSNNTVNSTDAAIVGGAGHTINGDTSVILGGESNNVNSAFSAIVGAASSTILNADTSIILGGYQNSVQGTRTFTLGGNQNTVNANTEFSGIIGGQSNQVNTGITGSVVLGGKSIAADANDTVFVPALNVGKGSTPGDVIVEAGDVNVTGSIIGSTSILAGQSAAAFSSDAVRLGNATTPVQYGNMIIHTDTSGAMLGNQYNGFTIDDPANSNLQLASSAFTGLGNTVHVLAWGGNSTGRADTVKLWSSGSGAELNVETCTRFSSGVYNDVNTITIASNTASLDLDSSNTFKFTAQSTATHIVATNIKAGQVINIEVTQDVGGAGTITFDPEFKFPGGTAPTLTTSANAIDLISAVSYDGTTLLSNATQNYS